MRFMVIVKANEDTENGVMPTTEELAAMGDYNEELVKAGVMLAGDGLYPSAKGARVRFDGKGATTVVDGPFTESKELIAGYTLIQVKSREEALEWAHRFPNPAGEGREAHIEVRQLFELDELGSGEWVDRFRDLMGGG